MSGLLPLIVTLAAEPPSAAPAGVAAPATVVRFTVQNDTAQPVRFARYATPFESLAGPIFDVVAPDGAPVPYHGPSVKRGPPGPADEVRLDPGESLSRAFDVAAGWAFATPGPYQVTYRGSTGANQLRDSNTLIVVVP